ncbi:MAG: tripartite tricarboxylate transporter substrate binding protein [Proteobacteria bacterium]|nr:tripartite tricarboxylate transporter substrate binding protein [Pseudomonadota bacterium]
MSPPNRFARARLLLPLALCLPGPLLAQTATQAATQAAAWPTRPVRLVVPYAPGGLTDVLARLVAQKAAESLGQPIVVENRPGASTVVGAEAVARAAPDGHTFLMAAATTLTTNPLLFKKLPYKPSDFTPVALVGIVPFALITNPAVPAQTVQEFIAYARANPDRLSFSTVGQGASSHLVGEMFKAATRTALRDIPYKGSAPALTAVLSGEVNATFDGITNYLPHARSGRLKILAVFSEARVPAAEMVPTMVESGFADAVAYSWFGVVAPAGTPRAIVERLNRAINDGLQTPELRERLRADASAGPILSPEGYGEFMRRQAQIWEKVIAPLKLELTP